MKEQSLGSASSDVHLLTPPWAINVSISTPESRCKWHVLHKHIASIQTSPQRPALCACRTSARKTGMGNCCLNPHNHAMLQLGICCRSTLPAPHSEGPCIWHGAHGGPKRWGAPAPHLMKITLSYFMVPSASHLMHWRPAGTNIPGGRTGLGRAPPPVIVQVGHRGRDKAFCEGGCWRGQDRLGVIVKVPRPQLPVAAARGPRARPTRARQARRHALQHCRPLHACTRRKPNSLRRRQSKVKTKGGSVQASSTAQWHVPYAPTEDIIQLLQHLRCCRELLPQCKFGE